MQDASDRYEAAMEGFISELNRAHQAAGQPTYSELQRVSERLRTRGGADRVDVLTRSNTNEILKGRRRRPPQWQWLQSFLIVLRTIARNNGIAAERIGTNAEWRRRHAAVFAATRAVAGRPVSVGRHRKPAGHPGTDSAESPAHTQKTADGIGCEPFQPRRQAAGQQWWHRYRGIAPEWLDAYIHLESTAKVVRTYEPQVIPGLLQAERYAAQVVEQYCPSAEDREIARLVEWRMQRQRRLDNPRFQMWAIIDEAALRNPDVDIPTMRLQIAHLVNLSELPNVTVQVLRLCQQPEHDDQLAIQETITQFRFPDEHHDDVVFLERPSRGVILASRKEIAHYSRLLSRLGMRAASTDNTHALLCEIFAQL